MDSLVTEELMLDPVEDRDDPEWVDERLSRLLRILFRKDENRLIDNLAVDCFRSFFSRESSATIIAVSKVAH